MQRPQAGSQLQSLPEARLAQPAERKALNLVVVGSSPTVGALLHCYMQCKCGHSTTAGVCEIHSYKYVRPSTICAWLAKIFMQ